MIPKTSRQLLLARRPQGEVKDADFELRSVPVRAPEAGEIVVENRYLSIDPTNRIWMTDAPQYMPPVAIGGSLVTLRKVRNEMKGLEAMVQLFTHRELGQRDRAMRAWGAAEAVIEQAVATADAQVLAILEGLMKQLGLDKAAREDYARQFLVEDREARHLERPVDAAKREDAR